MRKELFAIGIVSVVLVGSVWWLSSPDEAGNGGRNRGIVPGEGETAELFEEIPKKGSNESHGHPQREALPSAVESEEKGNRTQGAGLRCFVSDDQGQPIEGAKVSFLQDRYAVSRRHAMAETDERGLFERWSLKPRTLYDVRVAHPRHLSAVVQVVTLADGELMEKDVQLKSGIELRGLVFDEVGHPIANALVWAIRKEGGRDSYNETPWTRTGKNGFFQLSGLEGDEGFKVYAQSPHHDRDRIGPVRLDDSGNLVVDEPGRLVDGGLRFRLHPGKAISGMVTDQGRPLGGVEVRISRQTPWSPRKDAIAPSQTDERGQFHFANLGEGEYLLSASSEDHRVAQETVEAGRVDCVLELERKGAVSGFVSGLETTNSSWRFEIAKEHPHGIQRFQSIRDRDGKDNFTFEFQGIDPGTYVVRAQGRGWSSSNSSPFEVRSGETTTGIQLVAIQGLSVTGRVIDATTAESVKGARVLVRPVSVGEEKKASGAIRNRQTDAQGRFTLKGLLAGTWVLSVEHDDYALYVGDPFPLAVQGDTASFTIELNRGATVFGTVLDRHQRPRPRDELVALPQEPHGSRKKVSVQSDGSFRLEHLVAGNYRIKRIRRDENNRPIKGNAIEEAPLVTLYEGDNLRVDFDDDSLGVLSGQVLENGVAVRNARIELKRVGARVTSYQMPTDEEGQFEIEGIVPSAYYLRMIHPASDLPHRQHLVIEAGVRDFRMDLVNRRVSGRVLNEEGRPLSGIRVGLRPDEERDLLSPIPQAGNVVPSGEDGAYVLERVPPGSYLLELQDPTWVVQEEVSVEIEEADTSTSLVDVYMVKGAILRGRILLDGKRIEEPTALSLIGGGLFPEFGQSEDGGTFEFTGLSAGTYVLNVAMGRPFQKSIEGIELDTSEIKELDVELESQ